MPEDVRPVGLENVSDVIRVMNESSQGMSFASNLDFFAFLSLSRYWNFSFKHSLLRYVDGKAAAVVVNCTDSIAREAYTFYWGALPEFRGGRMSLRLFDLACQRLREDGYVTLHGASVPDRPAARYRFIDARTQRVFAEMECESPELPAADGGLEVREIDIGLLSKIPLAPGEVQHWCQRVNFLRNGGPLFRFLGCYAGNELKACAVDLPKSANTSLVDLRSAGDFAPAGNALLHWLLAENYRPPFLASYVFEDSYAWRLLGRAGFTVKHRFSTLSRDLLATCPAPSAV